MIDCRDLDLDSNSKDLTTSLALSLLLHIQQISFVENKQGIGCVAARR